MRSVLIAIVLLSALFLCVFGLRTAMGLKITGEISPPVGTGPVCIVVGIGLLIVGLVAVIS